MSADLLDWRKPYRSMDASGSPDCAENVGWAWIEERASEAKEVYEVDRLFIDSPTLPGDGRVIALYLDRQPIAVATVFRDQMNFSVLVRWAA